MLADHKLLGQRGRAKGKLSFRVLNESMREREMESDRLSGAASR